jgi:hypothetical protein
MNHFYLPLQSSDPDPVKTGDTLSWFRYYKWCNEGETFIRLNKEYADIKAGDYLWFSMDRDLFGGVRIKEAEVYTLGGSEVNFIEVFYDGESMLQVPPMFLCSRRMCSNLPADAGDVLLKYSSPGTKNRLVLPNERA